MAPRPVTRLRQIKESIREIHGFQWKQEFGGEIPWQKIAAFGNVLRHAYDNVDIGVLWSVYLNDLGSLEGAIDAMLVAHAPKDPSP